MRGGQGGCKRAPLGASFVSFCRDHYQGAISSSPQTRVGQAWRSPRILHFVFSSRELGTQSPVTHHSCVAYTAHTSRSRMASAPCPPPPPHPPPPSPASRSDTLKEGIRLHLELGSQEPRAPPSCETQSMTQRIKFSTFYPS